MTWPLEEAIVAFARALPATQVDDVARVIDHIPDPATARPLVLALVPNARYQDQACHLLDAWAGQPAVGGTAVAVGVRSAARAAQVEREVQRVELVWTGPTVTGIPIRHTYAVLVQVIDAARRRLTLVSFAAYTTAVVTNALRAAAARGVDVRLVLDGGTHAQLAFATLGASIKLLTWPPTLLPDHDPDHASMHAKCAVADADVALVTSANLTSHALDRNIELGVLITGGDGPARLADHLEGLVASGVLTAWTP
jgi:phosphatidylserine/phosphatidylglycerophosphate/cardiolipin synthase-like enzyme